MSKFFNDTLIYQLNLAENALLKRYCQLIKVGIVRGGEVNLWDGKIFE